MGLARGLQPHPRAIIFDLDRTLIDSRAAWRYCVEESIAACSGRRLSAEALVEEYHVRPWRDAVAVLAQSEDELRRCPELCQTMFERSAMKKLLVHEGIGMALDGLRGEQIELGAVSRLPHRLALKQVQSTGLDRFLAVLSATPEGTAWEPGARALDGLTFLEALPGQAAFMSGSVSDRRAAADAGLRAYAALWSADSEAFHDETVMPTASEMLAAVLRDWAQRSPR